MILGRRAFLSGLGALLAAPAIVHAGNLMPVSAKMVAPVSLLEFDFHRYSGYEMLFIDGDFRVYGPVVRDMIYA